MTDKSSTILLAVAAVVIVALLFLNQKKTKEIKKLRTEIDQNRQLKQDVRQRLKDLLESNKDIDPQVAEELMQISALIEIKQETKALLSLAKIIEKLLKQLYKDDPEVLAKSNNPSFADYLEHAKQKKVISVEDFHLISVLRLIRNQEAHELNVKKEQSRIAAAFVAGMAFVLTLTRLLRKRVGAAATAPIQST
ncbi:MAG: hypothetical protein KIT50_12160 [Bacteroidetes bacterium]|nr:hypothetical protein [Bacteroidota bacterium]